MLLHLFDGFSLKGDLSQDVPAFLQRHGCEQVATHVAHVAANARNIAPQAGADEQAAVTAAWLHDISWAVSKESMVEATLSYGVDVLPEERLLPMLVHGKLSAVMAEQFFGVTDPVVLAAIRCHTTLRPRATQLDKVLFIADKLGWAPEDAPYYQGLQAAMTQSLDHAVKHFLQWSIDQRYAVVHPWLRQAFEEHCL